ncbi:uncharacterized protein AB675_9515 [Cyphellophora attinorum]|uniref:Uncharacterized protein n=1 Tax=Cyphellophora attinorum TaxID=1664694 RepID=A0A0N0NP35_9EURO|nr:uncharacterized protein AB675_9515 [Phialophora attinorum]KPI42301.1 hypothetical protein AB675_9515 [Phialophora attinorum]
MARRSLSVLLAACAVLAQWAQATPVHSHRAAHIAARPRHSHDAPSIRHLEIPEEPETRLGRRSENDTSDDVDDRTWLDDHSDLQQSDLADLLDELGLSYGDVRELVKRYGAGQTPPQQCTSTVTTTLLPTATASQPSSQPTNSRPPPSSGTGARNMNVVYYAQTPATAQVPLTTICNDTNIDIVILAFVTDLFTAGGYPTVS